MKIIYIGGGYVGTCSAAVSADSGHDVLVYDINKARVSAFSSLNRKKIEETLFEEGLADLIIKNKNRLRFTDKIGDLLKWIDETAAIFMCLPTPEKKKSGETDLSYYKKAIMDLAKILSKRNDKKQTNYVLLINKSTVPLGMTFTTEELLKKEGVKNFGVGSNPEFLVEGKAIEGSVSPDRVVVGAWTNKDFSILRDIYKRFYDSPKTDYIEVNPQEAEAGKLLANFSLFNKIAVCYDVIGRIAENFPKLHFENLRKVLVSDRRIGNWGMYDSLFSGGSCFIKDARSLSYQLRQAGANSSLVENVLAANQRQLDSFLRRPEKELKYTWKNRVVALMGAAFKRDTNDIRNSGAIGAAEYLLKKGVKKILVNDPAAADNFVSYFNNPRIVAEAKKSTALSEADVILIATDWPEYRELSHAIVKFFKRGNLIMDGRRMLHDKYEDLSQAGYDIIAVGSPLVKGKK